MSPHTLSKQQVILQWKEQGIELNFATSTITRNAQTRQVEPLVMELLNALLSRPNEVVSKADLMDVLWANRFVNEETLTKLISKLRKTLGDDPKNPCFIKTIPKKGYVLLVESTQPDIPERHNTQWIVVASLGLILGLMLFISQLNWQTAAPDTPDDALETLFKRAESHYYQYSRLENESAIRLYEQIIAQDDEHALSQSGLANALVQKTLRWPNPHNQQQPEHINLATTIATGRLNSAEARSQLNRAAGLAERAIRLAPDSARAHRSLGLVYAALQRYDQAEQQYTTAIRLDPDEWGALINLSEIQSIRHQPLKSLATLKQAHEAMTRTYESDEVIIRPWHNKLAILIASQSEAVGQTSEAEVWYRIALKSDPYNEDALRGLMALLQKQGAADSAKRLCFEIKQTIDSQQNCD